MHGDVARLFDAMAASYDELEPWYEHLYAVLHAILREAVPPAGARPAPRALDAGCGTGFQAALLAGLGYRVHGLDLSAGALAVARARLPDAALARATLESLPYRAGAFDVVVCCGSTLSYLGAPAAALAEFGRVLAPGGRLLLECEHRPSLDLGWMLLGALAGGALGYGVSLREAGRALRPGRRPVVIDYPGYGRLRLFTRAELAAPLAAAGLRVVRTWGIHVLTNLIPSTLLHRPRLGRGLAALYAGLAALDGALRRAGVGAGLANSVVVLAEKRGGAPGPSMRCPGSGATVPHGADGTAAAVERSAP